MGRADLSIQCAADNWDCRKFDIFDVGIGKAVIEIDLSMVKASRL
jgi:hypothetical protein